MEIIKVIPSNSNLWDQVWRLYSDSFPEHERRRISSHTRASEDNDFHTYMAVDNGNLLAILFYWQYDSTIYIEHIAVSPTMRGKNIGSTLLREFIEQNKNFSFILEIEPPVDEITKRRLSFYEKLGFRFNDYDYTHPSYNKKGPDHKLNILSYPDKITKEQFDRFKEYAGSTPLKYID